METILGLINDLPFLIKLTVGVLLWAASCILAINIAFGKDSLFMYKQVEHAVGPIPAVILFHAGWLLWPIGLCVLYGGLYIACIPKEDKMRILRRIRKTLYWLGTILVGMSGLVVLWLI